jgi:hypothetical protein
MRLIRYRLVLATTTALLVALAGCASQGGGSAATDKPAAKQTAQTAKPAAAQTAKPAAAKTAKAADAAPPKGTRLANIALGMTDLDVRKAIGEPDSAKNYMTGKAWIPFYWGPDVARTDWMYKGQGRVVFSRNRYTGGLKVIRVTYDPSQAGS